ncbi:MAG: hypothetical protein FJ128_11610 [Deltaproteobacteria bacterium]|nr:hypothetical protein [Deltaproteobacteria bacterium]
MPGSLKEAIETLLAKREQVYNADSDRLVQDARGARRAARDYRGRWLLELLQNCDDAHARLVRLVARNGAIYVADQGEGFVPSAVAAISGTDLSDKPEGTIGRKGVGFKAVFEITAHPQIYSQNNEGLEFDEQKALEWLLEKGLPAYAEIPFQWLPFSLERQQAAEQDQVLSQLSGFTTVIKLPLAPQVRAEGELAKVWSELRPENFLPFSHVRNLQLVRGNEVQVWKWRKSEEDASGLATALIRVSATGQVTEQNWRILRREMDTPSHLLEKLSVQDREHARKVSWMVAAPVAEQRVTPTDSYRPVQVFYPTRVPAPVPLLLHGEFLVNTERTAIIEDHPFNEWVAAESAGLVVQFVQDAYQPAAPAAFLRLLLPYEHMEGHEVTRNLWASIRTEAQKHLRLPDVEGEPRLRSQDALVPPASDLAHELLCLTPLKERLVHREVSRDPEVVTKVLQPLGVKIYQAEGILKFLQTEGKNYATDKEWLWLAWQWLAEWVGETGKWSEERKERVKRVRSLPLLPVDGELKSARELKNRFITWRERNNPELPEWLPLAFLDSWFASRVKELAKDKENKVHELLGLSGSHDKSLGIRKPTREVWREALEQAIEDYWLEPEDAPERFGRFLLVSGWYEEIQVTEKLKRCPIPVRRGGRHEFEEGGKVYFPASWGGGELLEQLWGDDPRIPWAQPFDGPDHEIQLELYRWLGVVSFSRITDEKKVLTLNLAEIHQQYKDYIYNVVDYRQESVKNKRIAICFYQEFVRKSSAIFFTFFAYKLEKILL